jgi:hypothetical protein
MTPAGAKIASFLDLDSNTLPLTGVVESEWDLPQDTNAMSTNRRR